MAPSSKILFLIFFLFSTTSFSQNSKHSIAKADSISINETDKKIIINFNESKIQKDTSSIIKDYIIPAIPISLALLAIIGSLITWRLTERSKIKYEQYKRKEEKYSALITSFIGFGGQSTSIELQNKFLEQLDLCWLYCPDDVIKKGYAITDAFRADNTHIKTIEEKTKLHNDMMNLYGEFIVALRTDLIKNKILNDTGLKSSDYQFLTANKIKES